MRLRTASTQLGFTLIEVLVALAIIGLALPALMLLVKLQVESTTYIRNKTYAQWVAVNQLTDMRVARRTSGSVPLGRNSGEQKLLGRNWYWHSATQPTSTDNFYRIEVKVGLSPQAETSLVTLVGFMEQAR